MIFYIINKILQYTVLTNSLKRVGGKNCPGKRKNSANNAPGEIASSNGCQVMEVLYGPYDSPGARSCVVSLPWLYCSPR